MTCTRCGDEMWVCEDHEHAAWNYGEGCGNLTVCCRVEPFHGQSTTDPCPFIDGCHGGRPCAMAGMPCPGCNGASAGGVVWAEPGVLLVPNLLPTAAPDVPHPTDAPRGDTERTAP